MLFAGTNLHSYACKKKAAPWGRRDENTLSIFIYGGETAKLQHRELLKPSLMVLEPK